MEYARILEVGHSRSGENGTLLATFEELNGGQVDPTGFPVYISRDVGRTWTRQSFVTDPGPLSAQWMPQLFELPRQLGDMPAGTILLAGVSLGPGRTAVMLYKSEDTGQSWDKVATVAVGGNQGGNGIYEPFLVMLEDGTLVCYYSDELERASHSQRLVYRTSKNGVNWNEPVEVVASPLQSDRPGMSVVTRLGDGRYFMVYEMVGRNGNPIYGRYSEDGLHWGDAGNIGVLIQSGDGKRLGSAPYCGWTEQGGDCGTLIVSGTFMGAGSSATGTDYFVSHDYGETWTTMPHPIPYSKRHSKFGYSNGFAFSSSGRYLYAVNNTEDEHAGYSKISFALVSLRE